ncbi:NAD(P)H-dependent oxidoreductase [Idiomarina seosinensis]|uniref:NADPH-dependent FMN reductase n=1 Tax=Idiomarina seosinensis TaxID=281739 RepID=UPI00384F895A
MTILFIGGSRRKESLNAKLKHRVAEIAEKSGMDYKVLDADALDAPIYEGDFEEEHGVPDAMKALGAEIKAADKIVLISPEYNSSVSPLIKNAIDWVSRLEGAPWTNKTVLLGAASPGGLGGMRGLMHLRDVLGNVQVWTAPIFVSCPNATDEAIAGLDEEMLRSFLQQGD